MNGAIFGPDLVKIGAQVSQGITDEVEVGGEINMMALARLVGSYRRTSESQLDTRPLM